MTQFSYNMQSVTGAVIQTAVAGCSRRVVQYWSPTGYWQSTYQACRTAPQARGWHWMSGHHWPSDERGTATAGGNCGWRRAQNVELPARRRRAHDECCCSIATLMSSEQISLDSAIGCLPCEHCTPLTVRLCIKQTIRTHEHVMLLCRTFTLSQAYDSNLFRHMVHYNYYSHVLLCIVLLLLTNKTNNTANRCRPVRPACPLNKTD